MDCAAAQADELEALNAILGEGEVTEVDASGPDGVPGSSRAWQLVVVPDGDGGGVAATDLRLSLSFAFPPAYPEAAALQLRARSVRGLSAADVAEAQGVLERKAAALVGDAAVFELATAAREWLRVKADYVAPGDAEEAARQRRREEDEAEAAREAMRARGTPVSKATYDAWWAAFSAEKALAGAALAAEADKTASRISGRAWFEQRWTAGTEIEEDDGGAEAEEDAEDVEDGEGDDEEESVEEEDE